MEIKGGILFSFNSVSLTLNACPQAHKQFFSIDAACKPCRGLAQVSLSEIKALKDSNSISTGNSKVYGRMQTGKFKTSYLITQFPLLEAKMTMGEIEDSSARCRYVKHSISSMWTSSTKSTPGTSSAMPWSMYLFTTLFISPRSLSGTKRNC